MHYKKNLLRSITIRDVSRRKWSESFNCFGLKIARGRVQARPRLAVEQSDVKIKI
ncbi:MAG TPA: hypothetical protein VFW11_24680 [Cyclobacteriaceae bacterium]|nr:hypothetical protein [Cyclobacteriaceae bacterium]